MKKKTFISSIIVIIISLFSVSYTFAADNNIGGKMVNGIRNTVGGAENIVEDAGSAVGRAVQDGMNYTTTRTSATMETNGSDEVSTTTYTWVIIGVTAVGIIVLLWSYFRQNNDNNLYIDSNKK